MKKRIFGAVLAAALIVTQAVTVFAAGSRTADVQPSGDSEAYYETTAASEETFAYLNDQDGGSEVLAKIMAVNAGTETLQSIADEMAEDLQADLEGKEMVTPFFDLVPINGGIQTEDGKYLVTLGVPSLTNAMTDVQLLHYSTERSLWELVTPTDVDYTNKEITAEFEDLSPVAVIAKVDGAAAADNAEGTSPKTGVTSTWMIWLGAAAVLAVIAGAAYRKSK